MKLIRRAALALAAMVCYTSAAHANEWKIDTLVNQVEIIPEARELQDTNRREFTCIALTIYFEAKGESPLGKVAVAHVVMNRSKSGIFPKTICNVVWQRSQFSWTARPVGSLIPRETRSWLECQKAALAVIGGTANDPTAGALYFRGRHERRAGRGTQIALGGHIFTRPN